MCEQLKFRAFRAPRAFQPVAQRITSRTSKQTRPMKNSSSLGNLSAAVAWIRIVSLSFLPGQKSFSVKGRAIDYLGKAAITCSRSRPLRPDKWSIVFFRHTPAFPAPCYIGAQYCCSLSMSLLQKTSRRRKRSRRNNGAMQSGFLFQLLFISVTRQLIVKLLIHVLLNCFRRIFKGMNLDTSS